MEKMPCLPTHRSVKECGCMQLGLSPKSSCPLALTGNAAFGSTQSGVGGGVVGAGVCCVHASMEVAIRVRSVADQVMG